MPQSDLSREPPCGYDCRNVMRTEKTYSYLNGEEWWLVHRRAIWSEIKEVVPLINVEKFRTKDGKE